MAYPHQQFPYPYGNPRPQGPQYPPQNFEVRIPMQSVPPPPPPQYYNDIQYQQQYPMAPQVNYQVAQPYYPQPQYQQYHQPQQFHQTHQAPPPPQQIAPRPRPMPQSQSQPVTQYIVQERPAERPAKPSVKPSVKPLQATSVPVSPKAVVKTSKNVAPPPADHQVLLLSLADDYFKAAHQRGSVAAQPLRSEEVGKYYKLIAMGLACLETVLKNWRQQPRAEALVRLRYANVLFEETENIMEAEEALTKGIALCEKNRMVSLKYNMQHLLARVMFRKSPKAALKFLDNVIKDVEAYQHISWIYAFKFLRVNLSLETSRPNDIAVAINILRSISELASRYCHTSILFASAILEALAHLQSLTGDAIEQAQRALALARSRQLDENIHSNLPQLTSLVQILDLTCSLMEGNAPQAAQKMQTLHDLMDKKWKEGRWKKDGTFSICISRSAGPHSLSGDGGGVMTKGPGGDDQLTFSWISKEDLYALAYYLSGAAASHKNAIDGQKAEKFLCEGIKNLSEIKRPQPESEFLSVAASKIKWRNTILCYMHVHLAFVLCTRTDWQTAKRHLIAVRDLAKSLGDPIPEPLNALIYYLMATIKQGTGYLAIALDIYQRPEFDLPEPSEKHQFLGPSNDLALLATLNTILILRDPSQPLHHNLNPLIAQVQPFCDSHPNRNIRSAFNLIRATAHPDEAIIRTKQYLQASLQLAQSVANNEITGITLNFMSFRFFRGVVGDQAEKSAKAGHTLAKKSKNSLWMSVSEAMLADTFEVQGKMEEAAQMRAAALDLAADIVPALESAKEWSAEEAAKALT